jgi:hypothetical protein
MEMYTCAVVVTAFLPYSQTSHNIDCVFGSLCYTRPCSIWIAWQRSSPMKGELRWRGPTGISKFHHHNINGGAVDDTWRHRWTTCKLNLVMRYLWFLLSILFVIKCTFPLIRGYSSFPKDTCQRLFTDRGILYSLLPKTPTTHMHFVQAV